MESKILTTEKFNAIKAKKRIVNQIGLFTDTLKGNSITYGNMIQYNGREANYVVPMTTESWENSQGMFKLNQEIAEIVKRLKQNSAQHINIAQFPNDYYDLVYRTLVDITRRIQMMDDWTARYTNEMVNFAYSLSVNLTEFLEFTGDFKEMAFSGDSVPLIQQKTGAIDSVTMHHFGLGHVRSLLDELYNTAIFTPEKVNSAFARAYVNRRNVRNIIGVLTALTIAAGWNALQVSATVTTGTNTYQENLYQTIKNALWLLGGLIDPQTQQPIQPRNVVAICGSTRMANEIDIVIRGKLNGIGDKTQALPGLPISEIVVNYGDRYIYGNETVGAPGLPENYLVLFVPFSGGAPLYTMIKRPLTIETGPGDVLQLGRREEARYFAQTEYYEEALGSSSSVLDLGAGITINGTLHGYGYCVVTELPEYPVPVET